jgi:NitT/TauT family transport system ATP-binding protein
MTAQPSVILEHVSRTFTRRQRLPLVAVTDFSLTVGEGEFVALVGASGCGKTTVLRMIADLQQPSEGRITRSAAVSARGGTSMVFQRPALLPWRTVLDNVLAPMEVLGKRNHQAEDAAHGLLRGVGLAEFESFRPAQLSGGMQPRADLEPGAAVDG